MLSGDVPQHKRMRQLKDFRSGKYQLLVATDVAGRGIHVDGISHVVNYNLPMEPENYVHRIGRTARAGASGISVSFADEREAFYLLDIEDYIGCKLTCVNPEEELLKPLPSITKSSALHSKSMAGNQSPHRGRNRKCHLDPKKQELIVGYC